MPSQKSKSFESKYSCLLTAKLDEIYNLRDEPFGHLVCVMYRTQAAWKARPISDMIRNSAARCQEGVNVIRRLESEEGSDNQAMTLGLQISTD